MPTPRLSPRLSPQDAREIGREVASGPIASRMERSPVPTATCLPTRLVILDAVTICGESCIATFVGTIGDHFGVNPLDRLPYL